MNTGIDASCPKLADRFSMTEKALMCFGFYGFVFFGTYAISSVAPLWGWAYLAFAILGFAGPVMGSICARCPYPYTRNTCLFFPKKLVPAVYKPKRTPLALWEKIVLVVFFIAILLAPLPWLIGQPLFLIIFYAMAIPSFAVLMTYYCKRCRNTSCLFNRAPRPAG
jgi:hypothetical protein